MRPSNMFIAVGWCVWKVEGGSGVGPTGMAGPVTGAVQRGRRSHWNGWPSHRCGTAGASVPLEWLAPSPVRYSGGVGPTGMAGPVTGAVQRGRRSHWNGWSRHRCGIAGASVQLEWLAPSPVRYSGGVGPTGMAGPVTGAVQRGRRSHWNGWPRHRCGTAGASVPLEWLAPSPVRYSGGVGPTGMAGIFYTLIVQMFFLENQQFFLIIFTNVIIHFQR